MKRCTLQDIFVEGFPTYANARQLHPREYEAGRCISQCYTSALGAHRVSCLQGDYDHIQYHACRHRSCPRCAKAAQQAWIEAQMKRLLPCPHGHVIFTVPHQLLALWEHNRGWFIAALFDSARQALQQLMREPARLGATPGILMSLHTWGRDLSHHPHLHCLVSAGGLDEQGQWRSVRGKWVLPWRPLMQLYRGKLLAALIGALEGGQLKLPQWTNAAQWRQTLGQQHRQPWSVRVCPVYAHGRGVTLYLARYAKGGPLSSKVLQSDGREVRMSYQDHRSHKQRWLRLPRHDFIDRVVWHAPPRGAHTTRHAGLYSTPQREQHAQALAQLSAPTPPTATCTSNPAAKPQIKATGCPRCGAPLLRQLLLRPQLRRLSRPATTPANSIATPTNHPAATGPPARQAKNAPPQASKPRSSAQQRCPTGRSS